MMVFLGALFIIASIVCGIMILIDAFQNEWWKGLLCMFCGLYALFYALVEYEAENKWLIVGISLLGGAIGFGLIGASGIGSGHHG